MSNVNTFNCLNPDNTSLVLKGNEWVNPNQPNFKQENKQIVKSIVQVNRERVKQMKIDKQVEGKSLFCLIETSSNRHLDISLI